ncbi:MAG: hypothetical protein GTN76_08775 [Candidatus Aenigmarchaeota archaeon]|nr:hypothetical protein [Candidatus Aenigmarchaeota archaeon]
MNRRSKLVITAHLRFCPVHSLDRFKMNELIPGAGQLGINCDGNQHFDGLVQIEYLS